MLIHQIKSLTKNYSTQNNHNHHFIIDYLINTLNFTKPQAVTASTTLTHLKTPQNPNQVITFLTQECKLTKTQIKNIITFSPNLLTTNIDKTLKPKFDIFQDLGLFQDFCLVKFFKQSCHFSSTRLSSNVGFLRFLLGSDEKVVKVLKRSWWMLSSDYARKMSDSLSVLRKCGLSKEKVEVILLKNPACLLQSREWLECTVKKVEPLLGVRGDSPRFLDGIEMVVSLSESTLDRKFGIFRGFGWCDEEIVMMTRSLPFCLRKSEGMIKATLEFFMKELGYTSEYLAKHPKLLVYSLEKRVKPRYKALVSLKEKKVWKNNYSLCSVVALSEEKFLKDFGCHRGRG